MVLDLPGGLFGQDDVRETQTGASTITHYYSVGPTAFNSQRPDTEDMQMTRLGYGPEGGQNNVDIRAAINLPHGAIVTSVQTFGTFANAWSLSRGNRAGSSVTSLAGGTGASTDTSITTPTIDNINWSYSIGIQVINNGERIYGAIIIYTTTT